MTPWMRGIRGRLLRNKSNTCFERAVAKYQSGDLQGAADLALQAARMGHAAAQCFIATMLETGAGIPQDSVQAAQWFLRAAEQGDFRAMCGLVRVDSTGEGVTTDPDLCARWLRRAAEGGDATGQMLLALAYREGKGVAPDLALSAQWLREAATQREPTACHALGIAYENGEGVERDLQEAFVWQHRAAESGLALGQYNLARMYANGIGTPVDETAAARWFTRAAAQGDADAQFNLGRQYLRGQGVSKDAGMAAGWLRKAVAQDHALAMVYLGGMYADGLGVELDLTRSTELLSRASSQGVDTADALRAVMTLQMQAWLGSGLQPSAGDAGMPPSAKADETASLGAVKDTESDASDFRRQSCFFAFHLFPAWLFGRSVEAAPLTLDELQREIDSLWHQAGHLEDALGIVTRRDALRPSCFERVSRHGPWWSVQMPQALKPPEPSILVVGLDRLGAGLFLAEVCGWRNSPLAWCQIDSQTKHSFIGRLQVSNSDLILGALVDGEEVDKGGEMDATLLLQHLTLYAEVASDFDRARALVAPTAASSDP